MQEFSVEIADAMAKMLSWIDYRQFAKIVPQDSQLHVTVHRTPDPELRGDNNVIYVNQFPDVQREKQISASRKIVQKYQVDVRKCDRKTVLSLLTDLESQFGSEGGKRFTELSYLAFVQANELPEANFWADFRTFIDVERATKVGHAFKIEHFTGKYFVINDSKCARIEHHGGAAINLTDMAQMERNRRDDL